MITEISPEAAADSNGLRLSTWSPTTPPWLPPLPSTRAQQPQAAAGHTIPHALHPLESPHLGVRAAAPGRTAAAGHIIPPSPLLPNSPGCLGCRLLRYSVPLSMVSRRKVLVHGVQRDFSGSGLAVPHSAQKRDTLRMSWTPMPLVPHGARSLWMRA